MANLFMTRYLCSFASPKPLPEPESTQKNLHGIFNPIDDLINENSEVARAL